MCLHILLDYCLGYGYRATFGEFWTENKKKQCHKSEIHQIQFRHTKMKFDYVR